MTHVWLAAAMCDTLPSSPWRECNLISDGVETFFSATKSQMSWLVSCLDTKTEVSRHETSLDISDLVETRRD